MLPFKISLCVGSMQTHTIREKPMSALSHLNSLQNKNQHLNLAIKSAFNHYSSDEDIKIMKRKRLRIEEEISYLSKRLNTTAH